MNQQTEGNPVCTACHGSENNMPEFVKKLGKEYMETILMMTSNYYLHITKSVTFTTGT